MSTQGRFVWYELMTTDPDRARGFYGELFNWKTIENPDFPGYKMLANGEAPFAGSMQLPEQAQKMGAPSHWVAYIAVDDVDAKAEEVKSLGGKVYVPANDIPKVGRFAVVADPQGAVFALFKGEGEMPEKSGQAGLGEYCWHELMATDQAAAVDFYGKIAGWTKGQAMSMGEAGTYQMINRGDKTFGGIAVLPPEAQKGGVPAHWLQYVVVEDINKSVARAEELGGTKLHGPIPVPGGQVAIFKDPTDAVFGMWAGEAQN